MYDSIIKIMNSLQDFAISEIDKLAIISIREPRFWLSLFGLHIKLLNIPVSILYWTDKHFLKLSKLYLEENTLKVCSTVSSADLLKSDKKSGNHGDILTQEEKEAYLKELLLDKKSTKDLWNDMMKLLPFQVMYF